MVGFGYLLRRWLVVLVLLLSTSDAFARDHGRPEEGIVLVRDGSEIYFRDHGQSFSRPTLFLVPGWGMDGSIWDAQAAALSPRYRVVSIDPRSQGRSSKTSRGNTPEIRAQDMHDVIQALDLKDVVLVGWSQGVQDVSSYVHQFGDQNIAAVVLVDAPLAAGSEGISDNPRAVKQLLDRMSLYSSDPEAYLRGMMQAIFEKPLPHKELERRVEIALQTPVSTGVSMLLLDLYGTDRRDFLKALRKPVLVIAASSSPDIEAQRSMLSGLGKTEFVAIEAAGHGVFVDQPKRFNAVLADFVLGLDDKRGEATRSVGEP